jgi:SAM-dependent methyltransferase
MGMVHYTDEFYRGRNAGAARSASVLARQLVELTSAHSVVDIGCGTGTWLREFKALGVTRILGLDGPWVTPDLLQISSSEFRSIDLAGPFSVTDKFDLALSLEVAEHLNAAAGDRLIEVLTTCAPLVAFSAAVPLQGGVEHINEQWPGYWIEKFAERGFNVVDCIRQRFWMDDTIEPWYRQNLLLFVHPEQCSISGRLVSIAGGASFNGLPVVHPEVFRINHATRVDPAYLGVRTLLQALPKAVRLSFQRLGKSQRPSGEAVDHHQQKA